MYNEQNQFLFQEISKSFLLPFEIFRCYGYMHKTLASFFKNAEFSEMDCVGINFWMQKGKNHNYQLQDYSLRTLKQEKYDYTIFYANYFSLHVIHQYPFELQFYTNAEIEKNKGFFIIPSFFTFLLVLSEDLLYLSNFSALSPDILEGPQKEDKFSEKKAKKLQLLAARV